MWKLYTDSACQNEFSGTLQLVHRTDLSDNPQDSVFYYANIDQDPGDNGIYQKQADSNPGTDPILLNVTDTDPGAGHEPSEITLATTAAALDTNTAGAALDLGTALISGVSNAQPVHMRVANAVTSVGNSTELAVEIVATVDSEV